MEHPTMALDCKGLSVLVVSETGVAYIWRGQSVQELGLAREVVASIIQQITTKMTRSAAEYKH